MRAALLPAFLLLCGCSDPVGSSGPPVELRIAPAGELRLELGSSSRLSVTGSDAQGHAVTGLQPTWSSADTLVAAVDATGLVVARRIGATTITARAASLEASVPVVVYELAFRDESTRLLPTGFRNARQVMEARAVDIEGDGDLDVVVAREFAANMLLRNNGDGTLTDVSPVLPQRVRDSEDIAVADLDRDGDLDIVVVSEDDVHQSPQPQVHELYLGDGAGGFTDASARIPVRSESNAVAAGDLDGDGDIDLILSSPGAEIVLINDGGANFTDQTATRMPGATNSTQDVALLDVDGDGDLDLVAVHDSGHPPTLFVNDGAGFFAAAPVHLPPSPRTEISRNVDVADVDGDGDLDLYISNATYSGGAPQDRLLLNDGAGAFTDVTATHLPSTDWSTFDAEFVDWDGDGDPDIIAAGQGSSRSVFALDNDGTGRYRDGTADILPPIGGGVIIEVEIADFDRDGKPDVLLTGYNIPSRLLLAR